jgi:hypothetical protein
MRFIQDCVFNGVPYNVPFESWLPTARGTQQPYPFTPTNNCNSTMLWGRGLPHDRNSAQETRQNSGVLAQDRGLNWGERELIKKNHTMEHGV